MAPLERIPSDQKCFLALILVLRILANSLDALPEEISVTPAYGQAVCCGSESPRSQASIAPIHVIGGRANEFDPKDVGQLKAAGQGEIMDKLDEPAARDLIRVRNVAELDWYVKESELVTATPGRNFIVAGAAEQIYRVQIASDGYQIR